MVRVALTTRPLLLIRHRPPEQVVGRLPPGKELQHGLRGQVGGRQRRGTEQSAEAPLLSAHTDWSARLLPGWLRAGSRVLKQSVGSKTHTCLLAVIAQGQAIQVRAQLTATSREPRFRVASQQTW